MNTDMKASTRLLLYALSAFMDMVAGTLLFVVPVRAAQLGASYSLIGALGVAWGVGAAAMTFVIGRFVTGKNAAALCIAGCLFQALLHAALILFGTAPEAMLPILFAIGLAHIMFFVPYQVFFKTVDSGVKRPLAASVAVYTFAWSLGMAAGPLWSGFLLRESLFALQGWQLCFVFTIVSCLLVCAAVAALRRRPASATREAEDGEVENRRPDFARIAWLAGLCGVFGFSLVRGLFPAGAVSLGVSEEIQGGIIFTMGLLQSLTGLYLGRILYWMYKPRLLALGGLLGVAGMVLFLLGFQGVAEGWRLYLVFFAGAFLFGAYSGSFYYYTVYHCLAHPSRAGFNIAMNEGMFAIANVVGLLAGGVLADTFGIKSPYLLAALLIVFFTTIQIAHHAKKPWPRMRAMNGE